MLNSEKLVKHILENPSDNRDVNLILSLIYHSVCERVNTLSNTSMDLIYKSFGKFNKSNKVLSFDLLVLNGYSFSDEEIESYLLSLSKIDLSIRIETVSETIKIFLDKKINISWLLDKISNISSEKSKDLLLCIFKYDSNYLTYFNKEQKISLQQKMREKVILDFKKISAFFQKNASLENIIQIYHDWHYTKGVLKDFFDISAISESEFQLLDKFNRSFKKLNFNGLLNNFKDKEMLQNIQNLKVEF